MTALPTKEQLLSSAREKIEALFGDLGFIDSVTVKQEVRKAMGPDFVVELFGKAMQQVLLIEVRERGEPRLAREAVNSLRLEMQQWSHAYPVFVAPFVSRAAAAICRENEVGYMDLAGNCDIRFAHVFIRTEGRENPYKNKRGLKSLARPKSGAVIRVLLNQPQRQWQTQELAQEAGVSLGLVSNVKKILKDREWIDTERRKIALTRPEALLAEWIGQPPAQASEIRFYQAPMDFIEIENALAAESRQNDRRCAFTGISGAVHLASGIKYYSQVQACVSGEELPGLRDRGFTPAGVQGNVAVLYTADAGLFYGMRPVLPRSRLQYCRPSEKTIKTIEAEIQTRIAIVSPVQIYYDLKNRFTDFSEEAEKILRQVIEPSW